MTAELHRPPGRRIPIDPTSIPAEISLLDWRMTDPGGWPYVVPGVLPVGLVLIIGRPGVAKTTLSDQFEHCIAARVPVAGWAPDEPGRVLAIDYEGGPHLAINRSARIAEPGSLPTDETGDPDKRIIVSTDWPGDTWAERIAELDKRLREAQHGGAPFSLVRIDTMRAFVGPVPQGMNTAQYESDCLQRLNQLAVQLGVCILLIHHPNKAGEVSGSVAIEGSCTAVYRIDRKAGECEGRLVALKNRVGQELSWPMLFDQGTGTWFISNTITDAQAANSGVRRAVLDWLVERGPATGPDIRAALAGVTTDATLKNAITRLANDGWLLRDREGVWSLAGVEAATCEVCGLPMTVVQPGQTAHPNCAAPERPPLPWGDGVPGDYWTGKAPAPAVEDGAELADVIPLPAAAEPIGDDDQGDDTGPERWPAAQHLTRSIEAARPRPVKFIAKEGSQLAQVPGRQHRGLPQWDAARRADRTVTGYSWRRPGAVADYGPGRLVLTLDKSQAFVAASETVAVTPAALDHFGPINCDPRELGAPSAHKGGRPGGLAGIVEVECPAWDHPGVPHPLGPKARPGELVTIPSNMVELLWRLHGDGAIGRPVVADSWLGPRHTGLFKGFAVAVREARAAAVHDSPLDKSIKRGSSIALSQMRSEDRHAGVYRPDWHAAVVAESMIRIWVRAWAAVQAGAELAGVGAVDETSWLIPADADPAAWLPDGYTLGGKWGQVRPKPVQFRADRADLTGIDAARIGPAEGHPGHVLVSGPLPLGLWVNRA